jgi:ATP-dependent exoDNAse (exonuclease V) alpha subunit
MELLQIGNCSNIALTNERCKTINNKVRKSLGKGDDYEVGDYLKCIKRLDTKAIIINKNYEYKIINVGNYITIIDEDTKETFKLTRDITAKHFMYAYCNTVHSVQGSSMSENVIVHQINHFYASRKWIYVSMSRCTNLNNLYIYLGSNELIKDEEINSYFKRKIDGYKKQDL